MLGPKLLSNPKILTSAAVMSIMYSTMVKPLREDESKCANDRFCFRNLKNTSMDHLLLYESHISMAEALKLLEISSISCSFLRLPPFLKRLSGRMRRSLA